MISQLQPAIYDAIDAGWTHVITQFRGTVRLADFEAPERSLPLALDLDRGLLSGADGDFWVLIEL